jgi:hypothetical protein
MDTPPDIIAYDYALTRIGTEPFRDRLLGGLINHFAQNGITKPFDEPGFEECCSVKGPTIIAVLNWMGEKWGDEAQESDSKVLYPGVHGYLIKELGFSREDLRQIKKSLAT